MLMGNQLHVEGIYPYDEFAGVLEQKAKRLTLRLNALNTSNKK